jgi:hypothetical protein
MVYNKSCHRRTQANVVVQPAAGLKFGDENEDGLMQLHEQAHRVFIVGVPGAAVDKPGAAHRSPGAADSAVIPVPDEFSVLSVT